MTLLSSAASALHSFAHLLSPASAPIVEAPPTTVPTASAPALPAQPQGVSIMSISVTSIIGDVVTSFPQVEDLIAKVNMLSTAGATEDNLLAITLSALKLAKPLAPAGTAANDVSDAISGLTAIAANRAARAAGQPTA